MKTPRAIIQSLALPRAELHAVVRIVLLYALCASLWILLSDRVVGLLFHTADNIQSANTLKGLLFVAITSVLLFFLVLNFAARQNDGSIEQAKVGGTGGTALRRAPLIGIAVLSLLFALLGTSGILQNTQRHRIEAEERLAAIAKLKTTQIEAWLEERRRDAKVVVSAPILRDTLPLWRRSGDAAAQQKLLARLEDFRTTMHYAGIMICDAQGEILLQQESPAHEMVDTLRTTIKQAIAAGETRITDLYLMTGHGPAHAHLDVVAPLPPASGPEGSAAIVLRIDVAATLYSALQSWPLPSASAEAELFRREGDTVLFLNELRHAQQTALTRRMPLTEKQTLAVQALAPDYRPGSLLEGVDYRGTPVLGVAQPVAGTSWWLIAKTDRDEVFSAARKDMLWIAVASLLTWLAALTLAMLFYQRRELQHMQQQGREQAEKLHALQLLDAVVGSSSEAIFAKDITGRYLLFNNEAARVTGKAVATVIGHDDRAVFPPDQAARIMAKDHNILTQGTTETIQEKLSTADGELVFLATKGPLRDAEGRIVGLFGIARDITDLKHAEAAQQRQATELAARNVELERFNRAMVGRELDMVALKRLVNNLSRELGREPPYALVNIDKPPEAAGP